MVVTGSHDDFFSKALLLLLLQPYPAARNEYNNRRSSSGGEYVTTDQTTFCTTTIITIVITITAIKKKTRKAILYCENDVWPQVVARNPPRLPYSFVIRVHSFRSLFRTHTHTHALRPAVSPPGKSYYANGSNTSDNDPAAALLLRFFSYTLYRGRFTRLIMVNRKSRRGRPNVHTDREDVNTGNAAGRDQRERVKTVFVYWNGARKRRIVDE